MMKTIHTITAGFIILAILLSVGCDTNPNTPAPIKIATSTRITTRTTVATVTGASTLTAGLENLGFDAFVEESYRRLLLRDPEAITELGLTQMLGLQNDQLTNISDAYLQETQALEAAILNLLRQYDRLTLTPEQQLTSDIYTWYLEDRVSGQPFRYNDYPINPTIFSVHNDLLQFFTDIHPLTNLQDAKGYVTRLTQVKIKFEQVVEGLRLREQAGVLLPRFLIPWVVSDLRSIAESQPRKTSYFTTFETRLDRLVNLNAEDRQSLLEAAEEAIRTSVIPAYQELADYLEQEQNAATDDAGVWKFSNGKDYYAYLVHHYTNTDLSANRIHELGMQELERIHGEIRTRFAKLGYPENENLPQQYARLAQDSGIDTGAAIRSAYEGIITAAVHNVAPAFDLHPTADVIVVGGPTGGYYMPPAVDGSRPGMFYARTEGTEPRFGMPTLAYHEAVPGHHFQIAIAQELNLPTFRRGAEFTAFTEGWALYAERLAQELGFYDNDPYGDLGRLQAEAFRAARLVVDTGIHSMGWTYDQAVDFMVDNTGKPRSAMEYEVSRYIVLPGQATAYYIGFMRILELRQRTKEALGDRFDLKDFHNLLLGGGSMPLDVLGQVVDDYIQARFQSRLDFKKRLI